LAATRKSRGRAAETGHSKFFVSFVSFMVNFSRLQPCLTNAKP
jgi:hypothetical protein